MAKKVIISLITSTLLILTGCTTPTGGMKPTPIMPSSSYTLAQAVQDALVSEDDPVLARVVVTTNEKTVILSGYVRKIRQSDRAELVARQVPGVGGVINNLIVRQ